MPDRRRRSPEGSSRRRKERTHSDYDEPDRMRYAAESLPSSYSSSSSYIDISHMYPQKSLGIRTFFTTPSERRRLRRRRSNRLFNINNSSSSSINSDLAYGTGFIKRPKRRGVRSRKGRERHRERDRDSARERESERSGSRRRPTTDAEILAVGAGLAKLAREQNKLDLRATRNGKRPEVIAVKESSSRRGLGPSKVSHGSDTLDEDGWESASDDESESSVDSKLAFGEDTSGGWFGWGKKKYGPQTRKSSIVDPRFFGPENSLRGHVTEPVGFRQVSWSSSSDFGQQDQFPAGSGESVASGSQYSLQHVYPVPTSDPSRFEAARSSVVSGSEPYISSRPGEIPLQQPQPITPVSQSVYEPTYPIRSEPDAFMKASPSSGRSKSLAEAALIGVAGAAAGAVIASNRRDGRNDRHDDGDRDDRHVKRRDSGRKDSKDDRRREKRDSPDREERKERRREKHRHKHSPGDPHRDRKHEKRYDEPRDDREERRRKRREERRNERPDDRYDDQRAKSEVSTYTASVDPFQYQVEDDAFSTPTRASPKHQRIDSIPAIVTVEREPDFARKRSSSIKEQEASSRPELRRDYSQREDWEQGYRGRDPQARTLHDAEAIYQETEHSTAPIEAAAITAAVAAITAEGYRESRSERRRDERRSERAGDYDGRDYERQEKASSRESKSNREPKRERDPIQEEADRAYREIIMARKIASQVIRSRSPSPDRSVIDKYKDDQEKPIVRIVTPPGMEHHKQPGPYDAPNADFQLDHILEDPRDLQNFSVACISSGNSNGVGPNLKLDPDASKPRPYLNLVRPTPATTPAPEKRDVRSETAEQSTSVSVSDVIIDQKGNVVPSPTESTVSKGVTWGENETKHYEVESPQEHKDEFISNPENQDRDSQAEQPEPSRSSKRSGWGAVVAGITGADAVAATGSSSETSKPESKSEEIESKQSEEPESAYSEQRQSSPPLTGSNPSDLASHIPGAFNDDLDFTATVAAGLQDTGFDPNIVIDDPSFRRRQSPPGSNEPTSYQAPFAETVSDLGTIPMGSPEGDDPQGFIMGEVASTPRDWTSVSPDTEDPPLRLSKKEQKKREKAARKQSDDVTQLEESSTPQDIVEEPDTNFEMPKLSKKEQKKRDKAAKKQNSQNEDESQFAEPSVVEEIVEEPESYFETPKKSKTKKSKKKSSTLDDAEDAVEDNQMISVPVDAFDDLRNGEDEWNAPKKSKKKSKDKSRRKSTDPYEAEVDPTEVALPPITPSEISPDGDLEESNSRSVVSADGWTYDEEPRKSKKKSRSGTRDDFDDTMSVASAPVGDDSGYSKKGKKKDKKGSGSFFGLFGSKSEVGAGEESPKDPADDFEEIKKKTKKSKRNSLPAESTPYGDTGSQSLDNLDQTSSNGNGDRNGSQDYDEDQGSWSRSGKSKKKSQSPTETKSSKDDSFLAKAGILGAGAGLAGAAVAIAAQHHQQSKADNVNIDETREPASESSGPSSQQHEILDPDISQRHFRPSIDPQYGDLLPLPPSDPSSPNVEPIDDLPDLPESRPETPEAERLSRDKVLSSVRKSLQETPVKSPSQSAVPLKFIMGNRSTPSSPSAARASPSQTPVMPNQESFTYPRSRSRPTSWDSTKEYKPLYLVESNRRDTPTQQYEPEESLPALPPSQITSRSSSRLDLADLAEDLSASQPFSDIQERSVKPPAIDTNLPAADSSLDLLDSQQSTPKAAVFPEDNQPSQDEAQAPSFVDPSTLPALPESPPLSPSPEEQGQSLAESIAGAALVSSIGYFASSPNHQTTNESWLEELPANSSTQPQPAPVEPMSKDRSSYLLQSSPLSKESDDDNAAGLNLESPTDRKAFSYSDREVLHSIQEREGNDIFEVASEAQPDVKADPESAPDASSAAHNEPPVEVTRDLEGDDDTTQIVPEEEPQPAVMPASNDTEPVDEFAFTKSKKGKKKDKKKGKDVSPPSAIDDPPFAETSQEPQEDPTPVDIQPAEESFSTKSKKEKKKDKKKGKAASLAWEPEENDSVPQPPQDSSVDASQDISKDSPAPDEFSSVETKKNKKKKGKSASLTWEPQEDENASQPQESSLDATRDIPQEPSTSEVATGTKKNKKKKGKSASLSWEPQEDDNVSQPPESSLDASRDLSQEPSPPDEAFAVETKKNKKKKGKSASLSWEPQEDDNVSQPPQDPSLDVNQEVSQDPSTPDESFAVATKKNKKKDKKKNKSVTSFEPEAEGEETVPPISESSQDVLDPAVVPEDSTLAEPRETEESMITTSGEPEAEERPQEPQPETSQDNPGEVPPSNDAVSVEKVEEETQASPALEPEEGATSKSASPEAPVEGEAPEPPVVAETEEPKEATSVPGVDEDEKASPAPNTQEPEVDEGFSMPGSKKNKKKGKKSQAKAIEDTPAAEILTSTDSAIERVDAPEVGSDIKSPEEVTDKPEEIVAPETQEPEGEFFIPGSKKNKKKGKKSQAKFTEDTPPSEIPTSTDPPIEQADAPETARGIEDPEKVTDEPEQTVAPDTQEPVPEGDSFTPKKNKKKGKKSQAKSWEDTADIPTSTDSPLEQADAPETALGVQAPDKLTDEPEQTVAPDTQEPAPEGDFFTPGSKKNKKKGKKSQSISWEDTADTPTSTDLPQADAAEIVSDIKSSEKVADDDFEQTPRSKKNKKKSKKMQSWEPEPEPSPNPVEDVAAGQDADIAIGDGQTEAKQEIPESENTISSESPESKLPMGEPGAELVGAALVSADLQEKNVVGEDDAGVSSDQKHSSEFLETVEPPPPPPQPDIDPNASAPDGLKAGYDSQQLSLARQLQEEFGAGSKKSKKDKKKRQSLPSTPDREASRSRETTEATEAQPRARSLSTGPVIAAETAEGTATSEQGKNVYSEDQLELARQLQAEFESGNKKSKKDKKKRQGLSHSTTYDEYSPDPPTEPSQPPVTESADGPSNIDLAEASPKGDGFSAGYQEDQLSLARQLQAEFGSGTKKSKKDKKRRSTSQTPAQETEVRDDYFGEQPYSSPMDSVQNDTNEAPESSTADKGSPRDGFAVGYSAEQLELARQLKEEFGSGSKSAKKDKKDKKRKGLRSTTDDALEDASVPRDADAEADASNLEATEAGTSEPVAASPEDEFGVVSKKSKKDKKDKKRKSLLAASDNLEDNSNSPDAVADAEASNLEPPEAGTSEPVAANPEDEFGFVSKKSKKDKKDKKRKSLLATDDTVEDTNSLPDTNASNPETTEAGTSEPAVADPEDEFASVGKKKKDKKDKKRKSLLATDNAPEDTSNTPDAAAVADTDAPNPEATEAGTSEPVAADPEDEFASVGKKKKDKKNKKKGLLRSTTDDPAEDTPEPGNADADTSNLEATEPATEPGASEAVVADPEDEFASVGKKKKDKKNKKKGLLRSTTDDPVEDTADPGNADADTSNPEVAEAGTSEPIEAGSIEPAEAGISETPIADPQDEFAFVPKKKKDKKDKKRKSLLGSTADDTLENTNSPSNVDTDAHAHAPKVEAAEPTEPIEAEMIEPTEAGTVETPVADPEDEFGFVSKKKKGKKDKKCKGLPTVSDDALDNTDSPNNADADTSNKELAEPGTNEPIEAETAEPEPAEAGIVETSVADPVADPEEEFAFVSKKSKKDKKDKKRKSLLSSTTDDALDNTDSPSNADASASNPEAAEPAIEAETVEPAEAGIIETPVVDPVADPEDEFAFVSKKSKKEKKDKKRKGLLTASDAALEDTSPNDADASNQAAEAGTGEPVEASTNEPTVAEPEDEFAFVSKKSKKDKKDKKRKGLPTVPDDAPENTNTPPDADTGASNPEAAEAGTNEPIEASTNEPTVADPEDEFAFVTKKSKKDKKKKSKAEAGTNEPTGTNESAEAEATEPAEAEAIEPAEAGNNEPTGTGTNESVGAEAIEPVEAVTNEQPVADPEDEFAFTTKKSKKDKKKRKSTTSGAGTNETIEAGTNEPVEVGTDQPIETRSIEPLAVTTSEPAVADPEDEFAFTTKKSKKDKKKRKDASTINSEEQSEAPAPLDSASGSMDPSEPQLPSEGPIESTEADDALSKHNLQDSSLDNATAKEVVDEPEDEWGSFSTKKSKKDKKKRKFGLSTPVEPNIAATEAEKPSEVEELNEPQAESLSSDRNLSIVETGQDSFQELEKVDEASGDAFGFGTKKSKKDKKKRKSGLSTPAEPTTALTEPEKPSETEELTAQDNSQEPEIADEATVDAFGFGTKKSKKDKKKRKSTLSTPTGETVAVDQPDDATPKDGDLVESNSASMPTQPDSHGTLADESFSQGPPDEKTEDNDFGFVAKKTKKGKKAKKGEQVTRSGSDPATPDDISTSGTPPGTGLEDQAPLEPEEIPSTESPIPEPNSDLNILPQNSETTTGQTENNAEESNVVSSGLGRKTSKKDKRKRQATIDASTIDEPVSTNTPAMSWAEEVEEAEVERKVPVIEDIAKDESLSQIASTTESAPVDDFSRPTKKGKKGKKKNSESSSRQPVGISSSKGEPSGEQESATVLAATATALAAEAIVSGKSEGRETEITSDPSKNPVSATREIESVPPKRKMSKKEKRKMSIDRRSASKNDDIFDDPALWEGAEPRAFEEGAEPRAFEEGEAEGGEDGDGFWSTPDDNDNATATNGRLPADEEPGTRLETHLELPENMDSSLQESEQPGEKESQLPVSDVPEQVEESTEIVPSVKSEPSIPESTRDIGKAADTNEGAPSEELSSTNLDREFRPQDESASLQDRPIEHEPITPLITTTYGHPGSSSLPVVQEESPTQIEPEPVATHSTHFQRVDDLNRDSALVTESPIPSPRLRQRGFADDHEHIRDSGVHIRDFSPAEKARDPVSSTDDAIASMSWPAVDENAETVDLHRSQRPKVEAREAGKLSKLDDERALTNEPLSSQMQNDRGKTTELHRTQTIRRSPRLKEDSIVKQRVQRLESPDLYRSHKPKEGKYGDLSASQRPRAEKPWSIQDNPIAAAAGITGAAGGFAAARQSSRELREQRPDSAQSQRASPNTNRLRTPDPILKYRPGSAGSNRSSGTPPLRRSAQKSGDLRSLSQRDLAKEAELADITASASSSTANPTANEGRVRAKDMADVYDGFGEGRIGSPRSPTRPHSMRRRQSMQVLDLESKLEQLAAENRMLAEAKAQAEQALQTTQHSSAALMERDAEIDSLKRTLNWLQNEVTRLTEVNEGLTSANITLGNQHNDRYGMLESQHAQTTRELQEVRDSHNTLTANMESMVRNEVQNAVQDKDREIAQLRAQLEAAKNQIREMQRQILASKANDSHFLTIRDEDYFDNACQQLCQHVQQWVLRFSKFSDMRACRLTSEINNDKTIDRLDNAILDGSDVDDYLSDRVKRRDVFMSMTMTMVWEFVFTRYLFGMDREQRQKLKSLEKLLLEVGPASAVHQWRATTLTLLSKRESFAHQREQDTLAVVHAIMETLSEILPPPSHLEDQIQEQLVRVMRAAVDLSIEMRTQRAEYMMLPPLQPEYDANGDLASKVTFNAALMNERSGDTVSNEELEAAGAVVKIVLFPLVVKKGDDSGEGDEEIVVCPAQVLVAKPKKTVRVFSPGSSMMHQNQSRVSMQSSVPTDQGENVI